jgi:hypothetical protein
LGNSHDAIGLFTAFALEPNHLPSFFLKFQIREKLRFENGHFGSFDVN